MNYKIIVIGSVGSGKTTAVNSLSSKNAVLTDAVVSDTDQFTRKRKETTTVAMDFDVIRLNDEDVAHIYGTPGQERFDFMWDILSQGAHGVILLLDLTRNYPLRDLKYYTSRFSELIGSSRLIIGLTHADIQKEFSTEVYGQFLTEINIEADVIPIDAREKEDVTLLFHTLLDIPGKKDVTVLETESRSEDSKTKLSKITQKPHKKESKKEKRWSLSKLFELIEPNFDAQDNKINLQLKLDEAIKFTENILHEVANVEHVNGVSLTNSKGELLHTTINDENLNEFVAFLSGITPEIENALNRGKVHRIMLRSPTDDNLTLFVEQEKSLTVSSDRLKSVQILSQQIEDLLQWL